MGIIIGLFETQSFSKIFTDRGFGAKIFLKTIIYLISISLFLLVIGLMNNSFRLNKGLFDPEVLGTMESFFFNFAFWSIVFYAGVTIAITLFISEVSDNLGFNVFRNFLTGRYHKPREEERVFMFLDMKSSTSIAEQLGHSKYYQLVNKYYADFTDAILNTHGEIYQYVGDEIVVSWELQKGLSDNNCIQCFFLAREMLEHKRGEYLTQFGVFPEFKAGFHYGKVTTGEVGVIKKDILFTGDVLNATARIQGYCNQLDVDLLVSGQLISRLELGDNYTIQSMGEKSLRGREATIQLYTLTNK